MATIEPVYYYVSAAEGHRDQGDEWISELWVLCFMVACSSPHTCVLLHVLNFAWSPVRIHYPDNTACGRSSLIPPPLEGEVICVYV